MTDKDSGGPAFPGSKNNYWHDGLQNRHSVVSYSGMSMREWYAGMALQGLIASHANPNCFHLPAEDADFLRITKAAFGYADAMIEASKK